MADGAGLERLSAYLAQEIPLTRAMQVSVDDWDGQCLAVSAPLAPNLNHKATAFGGSLYALAVLAGWGLIVLRLWQEGLDCEVVVQSAEVEYLEPVNKRLAARCTLSDDKAWRKLLAQLRRRGRARITLHPCVPGTETDALRMRARFVAISR